MDKGPWVTLLAANHRRGGATAPRTTPQVALIWKNALEDAVRSSPVLIDDVVYVTCRDGRLHAFERRSGKTRWSYRASAPSDSTPSISGALVLF